MKDSTPSVIYLKEYTQPSYWIDDVALVFELGEEQTRVCSTLSIRKNDTVTEGQTLILHGEGLTLGEIKIDGSAISNSRYSVSDEVLSIHEVPDNFTLEIETFIKPQENTSLEGLYKSSGNFCTQCEAEGFRKITYFLDRPDVMATFTTTIVADANKYPVMLSNGNPAAEGIYDDGRSWVTWIDPYKKPCYLFALVAGNLHFIEDSFKTMSGRDIQCRIYVQKHNIDQCDHAMRSLIKAMRWDEETYGREYDLDVYNIVAVDDFNMGAMENKGLNVFNSKYVLARQETATDSDFINIEAVIAHEYFHNWSGNRVTCRDWFQLTLKEGLTVFRDQQFTADMNSAAPKRIDDVNILRTSQFAEDAGPMAHPIQPDSYLEINNFYTVTVYNKGAEVIRMIHTLLSEDMFRKGMDLYFDRHDGQAVTTEEFLKAMEDASDIDLKLFRNWYHQAGTPVLSIEENFDEVNKQYTIRLSQETPDTPEQNEKKPFLIPVAVGLMDDKGNDLVTDFDDEVAKTHVLKLSKNEESFVFENIENKPILSFLRNFSAPVKTKIDRSNDELAFAMAHDSDDFNRWDAGQQLSTRIIFDAMESIGDNKEVQVPEYFISSYQKILADKAIDKALVARALTLPSHSYIAEMMDVVDVDSIHLSRESINHEVAARLKENWLAVYHENKSDQFDLNPQSMGRRFLKNQALDFLVKTGDDDCVQLALNQFDIADNMTDQQAAFRALVHNVTSETEAAISAFYMRWKHDPLVMDKWFMIQATVAHENTLDRVEVLFDHDDFDIKNPNRVRSLLGAFCSANPYCFHEVSGRGYSLLGKYINRLNDINPQIAARLTIPLTRWKRYDDNRQSLMKSELESLLENPHLSRDVFELVSKSLK